MSTPLATAITALCFFVWLSSWMIIGYFSYRWYVLFYLQRTPIIRKFKPTFNPDFMTLGDGYRVESQLFAGKSDIIFITLHGMGGDVTEFIPFAKAAQVAGHSTLVWSQRNWGRNQSDSSFTIKTLIDDANEVAHLIFENNPTKRVVFVGHSLGAMSLAKLMSDYHDFPVDTRFCLINFVTKRWLSAGNFSATNWFLVRQFFRGIFFKKTAILRLQPNVGRDALLNPSIQKVIELDTKKVIPFSFMSNAFALIYRVVADLSKNRHNQILLVFGGKDRLQNQRRIKSIARKFYKKNPNMRVILHPNMHHLFPDITTEEKKFYSSIIRFGSTPNLTNIDNSQPISNKTQYTPNVNVVALGNEEAKAPHIPSRKELVTAKFKRLKIQPKALATTIKNKIPIKSTLSKLKMKIQPKFAALKKKVSALKPKLHSKKQTLSKLKMKIQPKFAALKKKVTVLKPQLNLKKPTLSKLKMKIQPKFAALKKKVSALKPQPKPKNPTNPSPQPTPATPTSPIKPTPSTTNPTTTPPQPKTPTNPQPKPKNPTNPKAK